MQKIQKTAFVINAIFVLLLSGFTANVFAAINVSPITWNVIGLDSNDVTTGPNVFPVGVRVCNSGSVDTNAITASFVFDSPSSYIALQSSSSVAMTAIAVGACHDVFFDIAITRNALAYDETAGFHIDVSESGGATVSTPALRELYVEHLISQNRNSHFSITVDGTVVAGGDSTSVSVGQTLNIKLAAKTATQGYEQLEKFLTLNSDKFRVNHISSTYTANAGTDLKANSSVYADGCGWVNDTDDVISPEYRECTATGKYGGDIELIYNITVLGGAGTSELLGGVIYDFSGSSYHYNSDYSVTAITVNIGTPSAGGADLEAEKIAYTGNNAPNLADPISEFQPAAPFWFRITVFNLDLVNSASGAVLTDILPDAYTLSGGSPLTESIGVASAISNPDGTTSVSWALPDPFAAGATATLDIKVNGSPSGTAFNNTACVTSDNDIQSQNNCSTIELAPAQNLADLNISKVASQAVTQVGDVINFTLVVTNIGPDFSESVQVDDILPSGYTLATSLPLSGTVGSWDGSVWVIGDMASGDSASLDIPVTVNASGDFLNTAIVSSPTTVDPIITNNTATASAEPSFLSIAKSTTSTFFAGSSGSFDLLVSKAGNTASLGTITLEDVAPVGMTITSMSGTGWDCSATIRCTRADTATVGDYPTVTVNVSIDPAAPASLVNFASVSAGSSYAETTESVTLGASPPPIFVKSFSPPQITEGDVSILTYTINNSANAIAATSLAFTNNFPSNLLIASTPSVTNTCGGTVTAAAGSGTLSLSSGSVGAGASCTISVTMTSAINDTYDSTTQDLTSSLGNSGTANDSLLVIDPVVVLAPPSLTKSFAPASITSGETSVLTLTIANGELSPITSLSITDTFPSGMVVATPSNASTSCTGGTLTGVAGTAQVIYSGGSVAAASACTISVDITSSTPGDLINTTGPLSTSAGVTAAASATLTVSAAAAVDEVAVITPTPVPSLPVPLLALLTLLMCSIGVRQLA